MRDVAGRGLSVICSVSGEVPMWRQRLFNQVQPGTTLQLRSVVDTAVLNAVDSRWTKHRGDKHY